MRSKPFFMTLLLTISLIAAFAFALSTEIKVLVKNDNTLCKSTT
jgi:hypothetical protein